MKKMRTALSALATVGLVATFAVTAVGSASAASCLRVDYISYGSDYARTTDGNGQCGRVGVRASFSPPGTSSTIYAGWFYGANYAQTGTIREIQNSWHSNSAG